MNRPSRNESRQIWKLLFLHIVFLLLVSGQEAAVDSKEIPAATSDQELESMSDQELEAICTSRGFELYRESDEATGQEYVFSHEDYIEAARQCLAVEREMGEILAEHPELVEELQGEVDSMLAEKERLEKEIEEAAKKPTDNTQDSPLPRAFFSQDSDTETVDAMVDGAAAANDAFGLSGEQKARDTKSEPESATKDVETSTTATGSVENSTESVGSVAEPDNTEPVESTWNETSETSRQASSTATDEESSEALADAKKEELPFLEELLAEIKKDLGVRGENIQKLFKKVADIVVPKPIRGPLKIVLGKSLHIAKDTSMSAVKLLNRYLRAFLQNARRKVDSAENKKKEEESDKQKLPQGTASG